MTSDLNYFSEMDLDKDNMRVFYNNLPGHLQTKFKACVHMDINGNNVLQGYRGPPNFCNNSSGDSGILLPSNGIQEIRFWWGLRKGYNFVPIAGQIVFGIGRTVQKALGALEWSSLYFDSKTGDCLSHDKNEAAEKLNTIGSRLFDEGKFSEAAEYYNDAYLSCSSGYYHEQSFKNNEIKANSELKARNLNSQGDGLFSQGEYSKAYDKYKEAYDTSQVSAEYQRYKANREKAQSEKDAKDLNSQGDDFFKQGNYIKARDKYKEAYDKSVVSNEYTIYKANREKAQYEIDAIDLSTQAKILFQQGKYSEAQSKYQEAYDKSQNLKEKNNYSSGKNQIQSILNKLSILDHLWAEAWDAENNIETDQCEKAEEMFRRILNEANDNIKTFPGVPKFKQYKTLAGLKIEGNERFNQGLVSQQDGIALFQAGQGLRQQKKYILANEKFKEAKKCFQLALEKFEIGSKTDQRFLSCVEFVREQINEVNQSLEITKHFVLSAGLNNLDIDISSNNHSDVPSSVDDGTERHQNYSAHI